LPTRDIERIVEEPLDQRQSEGVILSVELIETQFPRLDLQILKGQMQTSRNQRIEPRDGHTRRIRGLHGRAGTNR